MSIASIVITVIAVCVFFMFYAAWPYNGRRERMREFCGWYYAHRGLHDKEDARALADRVALMSAGRILRVGAPEELCP